MTRRKLAIIVVLSSAVAMVALLLAIGLVASSQRSAGKSGGRVLAPGDLAGGTDPCVKSYKCETPFVDGGTNCAYCGSTTSRDMCCNEGQKSSCDYSGFGICTNNKRHVGTMNGDPSACNTCGSLNFKEDGTCTSVKDASGDKCAAP